MDVVLDVAPLAEGEVRGVRVGGDRWVLLARIDGRVHAIDDACNHAGCLLSGGAREGTAIVCPCHGLAFDLRDGRLLTPTRIAGDQATFPVEEDPTGRLRLRLPER